MTERTFSIQYRACEKDNFNYAVKKKKKTFQNPSFEISNPSTALLLFIGLGFYYTNRSGLIYLNTNYLSGKPH